MNGVSAKGNATVNCPDSCAGVNSGVLIRLRKRCVCDEWSASERGSLATMVRVVMSIRELEDRWLGQHAG